MIRAQAKARCVPWAAPPGRPSLWKDLAGGLGLLLGLTAFAVYAVPGL